MTRKRLVRRDGVILSDGRIYRVVERHGDPAQSGPGAVVYMGGFLERGLSRWTEPRRIPIFSDKGRTQQVGVAERQGGP